MPDGSDLVAMGAWWWSWFWPAFWLVGGGMVLVGIACRVLPGVPARAQSVLWRLAHLKAPILLLWPAPLYVACLPPRLTAHSPGVLLPGNTSAAPAALDDPVGLVLALGFLAWAAGLVVQLRRLARGWRAASALKSAAAPCPDPGLHRLLRRLARCLGCRRSPQLLVAPGIGSPMLVGLHRPAIVLPTGETAARGSPALLAHELAHLRRHDIGWRLFESLVQAVLWPLPLVWRARTESDVACEAACDEAAIDATGTPPASYAQLLLSFAACRHTTGPPAGTAAAGGPAALLRRFRALETHGSGRGSGTWARLLVPAVAVALPVIPVARETPAGPHHPGTAASVRDSASLAKPPRIHLFRRRGDSTLLVVVEQHPGGLLARVEHDRRPRTYRLTSLSELAERDAAAFGFVRSSVRPTAERRWLFGETPDDPLGGNTDR